MKVPSRIATVGLVVLCGLLIIVPLLRWPQQKMFASFATSLKGRDTAQRDNAERALDRLNGITISPGTIFSFNHSVGTFSRDKGYVRAPVSYDGVLINDWGGGVCQASTTLYNAALEAGMTIIERHRHEFPPGYISVGRDAAVAYFNIDLKFKNPYKFPVVIREKVEGDRLIAEFYAAEKPPVKPVVFARIRTLTRPRTIMLPGRSVNRLSTLGEPGVEVSIFREMGPNLQLVSHDVYQPLNTVVYEPEKT